MLDTDTLRRINNQRRDYVVHPFRVGGAGLEDFAELVPRFTRIDENELSDYLNLIDEVSAGHNDCSTCLAKILAFSELFTENRFPDRHNEYRKKYETLIRAARDQSRDYRAEVRRAVEKYGK